MDNVLPVEDFQTLSGDQQSEEIFRLLSLLSPFAGEVGGLKASIDSALARIRSVSRPVCSMIHSIIDAMLPPTINMRVLYV